MQAISPYYRVLTPERLGPTPLLLGAVRTHNLLQDARTHTSLFQSAGTHTSVLQGARTHTPVLQGAGC